MAATPRLVVGLVLGLLTASCSRCEPAPAPDAAAPDAGVPVAASPPLPGVDAPDAALSARLREAARAFREPGSPEPRWVNRLALETSPYLRQHAFDPVDWYPWGDEALTRARRENRPILLSIGYATCHWCHVMARESFRDPEVAELLNRSYVCIKVDREERPDVDAVYMRGVELLSGMGGWPLTALLTPEAEPFFGATYIPPDAATRTGRGLLSVLRQMRDKHAESPNELAAIGRDVSRRLSREAASSRPDAVPGPDALVQTARRIAERFDPVHGGLGGAPKFPPSLELSFLLRYHRRTGDEGALRIVVRTLEAMAASGLRDFVGGGFHRYAVDAGFRVPHFEKMLYDNAQLALLYAEAHQVTGRDDFAAVARETLDYLDRELGADDGGFHTATDAESPGPEGEGVEGLYFTWTRRELAGALEPDAVRLLAAISDLDRAGEVDGRLVLRWARPAPEVARELGQAPATVVRELARVRQRLGEVRRARPPPARDDKILAAWNGLAISAFARAGLSLGEPRYLERARRAAVFVLEGLRDERGRLHRSRSAGALGPPAFLDDHALVIRALLDLQESDPDPRWMEAALALQRFQDERFADARGGGYFRTTEAHDRLLHRDRPFGDRAVPSGNAVAADNLVRLAELTADDALRARAEGTLGAAAGLLSHAPEPMPAMASALDRYLDRALCVLVVLPPGGGGEPLVAELGARFVPNRAALVTTAVAAAARVDVMPVLEGKVAIGGRATAYVCEHGRCELPTDRRDVLRRQLAPVRPLAEPPPAPLALPAPPPAPGSSGP